MALLHLFEWLSIKPLKEIPSTIVHFKKGNILSLLKCKSATSAFVGIWNLSKNKNDLTQKKLF